MNPNQGQPVQDPLTPITPTPQDFSTANQQIQQEEQGLGDIFGDDILKQKPQASIVQEPVAINTPVIIQPTLEPQVQIQTPQINTDPIPSQFSQSQFSQETPIWATPIVEAVQQSHAVQQPTAPQIQMNNEPTQPIITQPQSAQEINVWATPIPQQPVQQEQQNTIQPIPPTAVVPVISVSTEQASVTVPVAAVQQEVPVVQQSQNQPINPTIQAGAVATVTPIPAVTPQLQTANSAVVTQNTPPKVIIKKWSKISPLKFAIGCGLFWFLLIGAVGFILFIALQNPTQFQGIIGIEGIKTGLKLFAGLFFGLLFLGSFILIIFNLYKLITQKTGGKIKYMIWLIFGALILGWTVFWGIVSFNRINEIIETTGANNSLLLPYIKFKDEYKPISNGYPIIAPTKVLYGANETLLNRFLTTNFVNKTINTLKLDCWNWKQFLDYSQSQKQFNGQCLYMKKGEYAIKFITNITDKSTGVTEDITSEIWPLSIATEIALVPSSGTLTHNDAYDEIIIGKAPTKINFDSTSVFTDLKLNEYKIQWDLDGDGTFDKTDLTNFSHQFRKPQVQSIYYTLPGIGANSNLVYQIDLRVLQNDVPICTIAATPSSKSNTIYDITTTFDTQQVRINSYMYRIKNLWTNRFLANNINNRREKFEYDFTSQGNYIVYLDYVTEDGKQGSCESDTVEVGASTFNVDYELQYKWPDDTTRKPLTNTGIVSFDGTKISTTVLPIKLLLNIKTITPQSSTAKTTIKLDNQIIQTPNGKSYEITLHNSDHETITVNVNDSLTQATSTLEFPIHILQEDIIGKLNTFPDSVGTSPFEVTLDASTTTLTDQDDEIIYFTWNYGDGEIIENSSQSRTTHTYVYDENNQNGSYNPTVTITTKKWKTAKFGLASPILVKKPIINSRISIDSHPAQIATVGDKVDFSLHTDGTPTHILRNFWTSENIECTNRSCANVPMFFTTAGTYTITATITYKDLNSSTATTKLIVEN